MVVGESVPDLGLRGWVWSNIDLTVCLLGRREGERPENLYHDCTVSGSSWSMLRVHATHISFHISEVSLLFLSPLTSVQLYSIQILLVFHSLVVCGRAVAHPLTVIWYTVRTPMLPVGSRLWCRIWDFAIMNSTITNFHVFLGQMWNFPNTKTACTHSCCGTPNRSYCLFLGGH